VQSKAGAAADTPRRGRAAARGLRRLVLGVSGAGALALLAACGDDSSEQARAQEGLAVSDVWCRASPQGASTASCFATIANGSAAGDRLVGAESSAAKAMELQETYADGNVLRMRTVEAIAVPPRETVELAPGRYVLRLVDLKAPLVVGATVPARLRFERAGEQQVLFPVRIEADPNA